MIHSQSVDHFQDLPSRLQALLVAKGMSQRELHERSGVSVSRINEYVNGKGGPPTLPTLNRLLDALGATRTELFSDPTPAQTAQTKEQSLETRMASLEERFSYLEMQFGRMKLAFEGVPRVDPEESGSNDDIRERKPVG